MNNLLIWYPCWQLHKINFMHCIILFAKNSLSTLLTQPTPFLQSNPRPHFTLKFVRSHTPTTLGTCCLFWFTIIKDHGRIDNACFRLWDIVMIDKRKINIKAKGCKYKTKRKQWTSRRQRNAKTRRREEYGNQKMQENLWNQFGRFVKSLEVKVQYHEVEVCYVSSHIRRITNQLRRLMKLVEDSDNISWKAHILNLDLHKIGLAHLWSHLTKGVISFNTEMLQLV